MNNIIQTIRHTARAATVLLIALLAAQTAGAQTNVSNAAGLAAAFGNGGVSVINVTDDFTDVGGLSLDHALTINMNGHTISGDGLYFFVEPDGSLTINGGGEFGSVGNIISGYAYQNAIDNYGTVTLSHVNITTNSDHAILGGTLNIGNNVSFNGWTDRPFDIQNVNTEDGNYRGTVVATVTVGGVTHFFENSDIALAYAQKTGGVVDFSLSGDTYTIKSATGWDFFCDMLEAGETFSGKTVKLDADITVTRMAGGQPFTGTFDGQNHKLTLAYGTAGAPVDAQFVAPFVETARDTSPVFRNLTIDGTIYDGYTGSEAHNVGGLIGHLFGDVTIKHCVSRVEIHAKGGAGGFVGLCEHSVSFTDCHSSAVVHSAGGNNSGFVAWSRASGWNINFTGCLFDGKLLQQNGNGDSNGGFIGWTGSNKTVTFTNSLCAPAPLADGEKMASSNSATFARGWNATTKATNCYYTQSLGAAQGKQARAVTAGTDVTVAHAGVATHYATSGITAYKATGASADSDPFIDGLLYNNNVVDVLYAGSDDVVSLTLSNTATGAPDGYQYGYTTNAGTLEGSTLTMPNQDVTVSVNTDVLTVIDWATVSTGADEDNAYMIYNNDQLDLLAHRVNGTHGETAVEDGYSGKYFKLAKDIKYTHKADGEEGADAESNYEAIGGYYGGGNRYFRGHFDGNNKTISGIRIYKGGNAAADYYQGIFGRTVSGADIHHLTLADARITGYEYTGGIVGENNDGTFTRCHVADDVAVCAVQSGAHCHGGIAGSNWGTIEQCTSAATLTTADADNSRFYGGIAGSNYGTLSDNLAIGATVPAAAANNYGAITGDNGGTLLRNYYAACKVADVENATGVGCNNADVTANNGARAVFALTLADGITTSTTVTVTIGTTGYYAQGTAIALSYSGTIGDVPLGYQYGFTTNAGTLSGSTLTMPDADVTVSVNTEVLTAIPWSGDGSKSSPYIIKYASQLDLLAYRVNGTNGETRQTNGYSGKYFKLANDISYSHTTDWNAFTSDESNFEAIGGYHNGGYRYFRGHFDGNNNTISGIRIYKGGNGYADYYQGIFGRTGSGADIHDLTLADARITGYNNTGGIMGENAGGTVTRCHVAGDVAVCAVQSNAYYHGGIAGDNDNGTIEQCTSAVTLTTADANNCKYYGGIAGFNDNGTLSDNLTIGATVPAAAANSYGAITGYNGGSLQRNYYTACKVADTENATGVGCGYIDDGNGGYITADVTANNGAVSIHTLTLADGITTSTTVTVTIGTTGYYAQGTAIALSYSGTPGNIPLGYQYGFTASAGTISGSTLTMPAANVTVSVNTDVLLSTRQPVNVAYINADGTTDEASAIALDGHEAVDEEGDVCLAAGTYYVGIDIAYANRIWLDGYVTLILADRKTMTLNGNTTGITGGNNLTIYGQSLDDATAGTLRYNGTSYGISVYNYEQHSGNVSITPGFSVYGIAANVTLRGGTLTISANGNNACAIYGPRHSILGGQLTANTTGTNATGIYASTNSGTAITLGCTTASDFIYVSSYDVGYQCTLKIADGQTLFDEDGNYYSGNGVTIPDGKTLRLSPGIALTARQAPDGNYWTTYYNGATGFTIDKNENACAYTATYGDGQLTLHKLGKEIPAGTAVIIVADNDVVSMTATDLGAFSGDNDLSGVDDDTDVDDLGTGTFYVLGMTTVGDEQHFGFHRYTGSTMAAHKAYVFVSGSQAARSLTMVFDDATGIESAEADSSLFTLHSSLSTWFTLDGRRLQAKPTAPGIYVNNGKKVVIK